MTEVDISELSSYKMAAGNEKKFSKVVHGNVVKQWVGVGWVTEGLADHRHINLPRVKE